MLVCRAHVFCVCVKNCVLHREILRFIHKRSGIRLILGFFFGFSDKLNLTYFFCSTKSSILLKKISNRYNLPSFKDCHFVLETHTTNFRCKTSKIGSEVSKIGPKTCLFLGNYSGFWLYMNFCVVLDEQKKCLLSSWHFTATCQHCYKLDHSLKMSVI